MDCLNTQLLKPPHFIKYMGSKSKIIDFVIEQVSRANKNNTICDLFAGSCTLSGHLRNRSKIISNDIQKYSSVIAGAYLLDWNSFNSPSTEDISNKAAELFANNYEKLAKKYDYNKVTSIESFISLEEKSRTLIDKKFTNPFHLFVKYYSGTWWSTEQCAWIDCYREAIEDYKDSTVYNTLLSSLMFAMAYCSQGTGHYAQYRDAISSSSMDDIMIYRRKSIQHYFEKKYADARLWLNNSPPIFDHEVLSLDYMECMNNVFDSTIYADPPYCFVHYSRFYHALETLVLYDYPELQVKNGEIVKGRYRIDRHQSPFSIRTKVPKAFENMFLSSYENNCNLVLSYSNSGMITLDEIVDIAKKSCKKAKISITTTDHKHMTMGRKNDRSRDIKEALIVIIPK